MNSMIKIYNCENPDQIKNILPDRETPKSNVDDIVKEIIGDVRKDGDSAIYKYTKQFDNATVDCLEVTKAEIKDALLKVEPAFLEVLQRAAENINSYHQKQKRAGFVMDEQAGVILGQKITPLDRVGVYVPGGTARYPSTVLMDIIPAKIAGVREVMMASPPLPDGSISPDILAAAYIAGADRIFKMGGAQAIAAFSYGTQSVPRVDKIVGPGNTFVATAKRLVFGQVDIDMIAGPSEILIIADHTANPAFVAADMLSQAEHDKLSAAILVTTSKEIASAVAVELEKQLEQLSRREIAVAAIRDNSAIIITSCINTAVEISNAIAPEHLEVCTAEPFALLPLIHHAGSIFLGHYAPEALGDYYAGPNHTLPTNGTARFSSALSVDDFCKKSSFVYYQKNALKRAAADIELFANHEGLDGHANSVRIRFLEENDK